MRNNKYWLQTLEESDKEYNREQLIDKLVSRQSVSPNISEWSDEQREISTRLSERITKDTATPDEYSTKLALKPGSPRYGSIGFIPASVINTMEDKDAGYIGVLGVDDGERVGYIARISERYGVGEIERFTGKSEEQILRDAGLVNDDKLRNMIMGEESEQTITNGINLKPHVIMDGDRVRPAVVGELIDDGITIRLQATRADKGGIDGRATMVVNGVSNEYHFEGDGMDVLNALNRKYYGAKLETLDETPQITDGVIDNRLLNNVPITAMEFDPQTIANDVFQQEIETEQVDDTTEIITVKATGFQYRVEHLRNGAYWAHSLTHEYTYESYDKLDVCMGVCQYTEDDIRELIWYGGREALLNSIDAQPVSMDDYDGLTLTRRISREYYDQTGSETLPGLVFTQELYDRNNNMVVYGKQQLDGSWDGVILVGQDFDKIDDEYWAANFIDAKRYRTTEWAQRTVYSKTYENIPLTQLLESITETQSLQFGITPESNVEEMDWSFAVEDASTRNISG